MNGTVQDHYENLLALNYSWMFGKSFDERVSEELALLRSLGLGKGIKGMAIDLGCGPGWQCAALADLGSSRVLGIDTSGTLLGELSNHTAQRPIEGILADMCDLEHLVAPGSAETVVCMGDTLPHLPDRESVRALFVQVYAALQRGGVFVLTFRDLSFALLGLDRIVPIRATDDRIMTCILDFGPERVTVTDVIHLRGNTAWQMMKSSYEKLRLRPHWVAAALASCGFEVLRNEPAAHLHAVVAVKPYGGC
jgi:SAM-dependent methyltransferase